MNENERGWNEAEERAFGALATELAPPNRTEDRIVDELRRRGLVSPFRNRATTRPWLAAAAAIVLLVAGFAAGRAGSRGETEAAAQGPRFALFLLRGGEDVPVSDAAEAARVSEYKSWARGLARTGRYVSGEKLEDGGAVLASAAQPPAAAAASADEVRGYFVISARSLEDAVSAARGCPHLKHGGRILVRPIAKT